MQQRPGDRSGDLPDTLTDRLSFYNQLLLDSGHETPSPPDNAPQLPFSLPIGITDLQRHIFFEQAKLRSRRKVMQNLADLAPETGETAHISGHAAFTTCLERTACGLPWHPGMRGGRAPYLCPEDAVLFAAIIRGCAAQMNCITTHEGLRIAFTLKQDRNARAIALLDAIGSSAIAEGFRSTKVTVPDPSWLSTAVADLQIKVKPAQKIDEARRRCCNVPTIRAFFEMFSSVLDRDPRLILNCDETHISSRKRFKVLVPEMALALRQHKDKLPHFSAMCTITASGTRLRPTILLPGGHTLPDELNRFKEDAYFVSTTTGWMTQHSFLFYVHFLLCELKRYVEELPAQLRGQMLLLIIDGHTSRWTFEAMRVLRDAGLNVLVLPAHCTHLLQPFDVSVASALKAALTAFCIDLVMSMKDLEDIITGVIHPELLAHNRRVLIEAFLNAWEAGASRSNILSGFKACGISPLQPEIPLNNRYARRLGPLEPFEPPGQDPEDMNCALVTGDDKLAVLDRRPNKVFKHVELKVVDQRQQWIELITHPRDDGRLLSVTSMCDVLKANETSIRLDEPSQKIYARRRRPEESLWDIVTRLADEEQQILFVFPTCKTCTSFASELSRMRVPHQIIQGGRGTSDERVAAWHGFLEGKVTVCLATEVALRGLPWTPTAFVVYPNFVTAQKFMQFAPRGDCLLIFEKDQDVTEFEHMSKQNLTILDEPNGHGDEMHEDPLIDDEDPLIDP